MFQRALRRFAQWYFNENNVFRSLAYSSAVLMNVCFHLEKNTRAFQRSPRMFQRALRRFAQWHFRESNAFRWQLNLNVFAQWYF